MAYKFSLLLILGFSACFAQVNWQQAIPTSPELAFPMTASIADDHITVNIDITPGTYLYQTAFKFSSDNPTVTLQTAAMQFPAGVTEHDEFLGTTTIYDQPLELTIPFLHQATAPIAATRFKLTIQYQGCAKDRFCYPPASRQLGLTIPIPTTATKINAASTTTLDANSIQTATKILATDQLWLIALTFLALGLLLSFTPCVWPMLPILSAIIAGNKNLTTRKAFSLALTYVLAMSFTYAAAGVLLATVGKNLQASLQQPIVIITTSIIFIALALSMFGVYELKLPAKLEAKLHSKLNQHRGGHHLGVAILGVLSTLVVSPCTTAPLTGALLYIANTGNIAIGAVALFALGLGMGIPLLIIGSAYGHWLPRAGKWMNVIRWLFGILLLLTAVYLLARIMPTAWFTAKPTAAITTTTSAVQIHNVGDLTAELHTAHASHQVTMLQVAADWCVACQMLEKHTLNTAAVQTKLKNVHRIKLDLTDYATVDTGLLQKLQIFNPPTLIFFNSSGKEIPNSRITAEIPPAEFLAHLDRIL